MTPNGRSKLMSFYAWLRRELPLDRPVRLRLVEFPRHLGLAGTAGEVHRQAGNHRMVKERYDIWIEKKQSLPAAVDALVEEWAHCLAGINGDDHRDHGRHWGLEYSKVTQVKLRWIRWRRSDRKV